MDKLPGWARDFAHETNSKSLDEMREVVKDVDRLRETLRRLIQVKEGVLHEMGDAEATSKVEAEE